MEEEKQQWCSRCEELDIANKATYICPECKVLYCDDCADEMICSLCAPVLKEIKKKLCPKKKELSARVACLSYKL